MCFHFLKILCSYVVFIFCFLKLKKIHFQRKHGGVPVREAGHNADVESDSERDQGPARRSVQEDHRRDQQIQHGA